MICAHLRSRLSSNVTLEYVAFAGPTPGDQAFVDSLDAMPGLRPRRVMYLGSGLKHPKGPYGTCVCRTVGGGVVERSSLGAGTI